MDQFEDLKNIFKKHPFILNGKKSTNINVEVFGFFQYGLRNYTEQNYTEAVVNFTKAIDAQPSNLFFYIMRGTAYEDMGNDDAAAKDFSKTLKKEPNNYLAAYRLGMVYFRRQDFENATKWLKVAFDNYPNQLHDIGLGNNTIFFIHKKIVAGNLGNFLVQLGRNEESIRYLDEAISIDSQYANPYFTKGIALIQMEKPEAGIPYIIKAAEFGFPQAATMLNQIFDNSMIL